MEFRAVSIETFMFLPPCKFTGYKTGLAILQDGHKKIECSKI